MTLDFISQTPGTQLRPLQQDLFFMLIHNETN
jgi:hypothetical protein